MDAAQQILLGMWEEPPAIPANISDLAATANLDGTITLTWSLPARATHAYIVYSVDQGTPPSHRNLGIEIGLIEGTSYTLDGVTYGADYQFAAWGWNAGGYSAAADTDAADGPFNPLVYSEHLEVWIDARRETGYISGNSVETPVEHAQGLTFTQATAGKRPIYVSPSGINGLEAFLFNPAITQMMWSGPVTEIHSNARGLTIATLCLLSGDLNTTRDLFNKWESTGNKRQWRLGKSAGDYWFYTSDDGTNSGLVAPFGGTDDNDAHAIVALWKPSTHTQFYAEGALQATESANTDWDSMSTQVDCEMRIGTLGNTSTNPWSGQMVFILAWSDGLDEMNATMLCEDIQTIGATS